MCRLLMWNCPVPHRGLPVFVEESGIYSMKNLLQYYCPFLQSCKVFQAEHGWLFSGTHHFFLWIQLPWLKTQHPDNDMISACLLPSHTFQKAMHIHRHTHACESFIHIILRKHLYCLLRSPDNLQILVIWKWTYI